MSSVSASRTSLSRSMMLLWVTVVSGGLLLVFSTALRP